MITPDHPAATSGSPLEMTPRRMRNIILLLAASVALLMTGYGIIVPVMAKRIGELGGGVDTLGFMTMAFALGQFLMAPLLGSLADRTGRKPLVLVALASVIAANLAFVLSQSYEVFITVRFFEGALTAGLLPAAMGVVGDIMPEQKRAQWIGIVMGSYGMGFIFGPGLGGVLYDAFGYHAPFSLSAVMAAIALVFAIVMVPETRTLQARRQARSVKLAKAAAGEKTNSLPRPLHIFATLLFMDFIAVFGFAFIEPQMAFFFYNNLRFSTTEFGLVVSVYGIAMVFGQVGLGRLSDRFGRKPVIFVGFLISASFYFGLAVYSHMGPILLVTVLAGLGGAIATPALSAFYLDISDENHRSRIMGMKESVAALGGITGPLAVALISGWVAPQTVFIIAGVLTVAASLVALVLPGRQPAAIIENETGPIVLEQVA